MGNSDYYTGYAAGQGAGANSVDVQGYYNSGFRDGVNEGLVTGADNEHNAQNWYTSRLMRHLKARNSQKQALMQALRKYAPDHPYLNETILENKASELVDSIERGNTSYATIANRGDVDKQSRLLALKMGGGIDTEGDLAMKADGEAFLAEGASQEIEDEIVKVSNDLNPMPNIRAQRLNEIKAAEAARVKSNIQAAKAKEKEDRLNDPMKPAPNFMANIFK